MARRMNEVYPRAIGLAAGGQVELDPLWTGRFGLAGVPGLRWPPRPPVPA